MDIISGWTQTVLMEDQLDTLARAVALQIRVEMTGRRWSQQTLANNIGVERATLNRYLQGERAMPLFVFFRVAKSLRIAPDELMRRAEHRMN